MVSGNVDEQLKRLSDPGVQKRALSAARRAILEQLKNDGVELTPELTKEVVSNAMSARDPGDVLAGAAAVVIGIAISDARLKQNINHVGISASGINVYEFTYKGSSDIWRGVVAQELLDSHAEAVLENKWGFLMVDYSKIDVNFEHVCPVA
jgi:hypothetical protein